MSEKKPCPFCGGEAELKHNKTWDYFVRCKSCGVRTRQHHENHVGAEMDWNKRTDPTDDVRFVEVETSHIDIEQGEVITRFVPERTCRNVEDHKIVWFICSECGYLQKLSHTKNYCPNCGRKVVGE